MIRRVGVEMTNESGESEINPNRVFVSWLGVNDPRRDGTGEEVVDTDADDGARLCPLDTCPFDETAPCSPIQLL